MFLHAPPEGECAAGHDAPQLSDQSAEGSRAPAGVLRCLQSPSGTEKVSSHRNRAKTCIRTEHRSVFSACTTKTSEDALICDPGAQTQS